MPLNDITYLYLFRYLLSISVLQEDLCAIALFHIVGTWVDIWTIFYQAS
jgi:hypothetical protein